MRAPASLSPVLCAVAWTGACAAPRAELDLTAGALPGGLSDPGVARAFAHYDVAVLAGWLDARLGRLEREGTASAPEMVDLARVAHRLADVAKLRATTATDERERAAAVRERLAVVERALPWIEASLAAAPDDPWLLFCRGELLAFRIDGLASGLRWGGESRATLARSPCVAARLALAKQYFYLSPALGGDLDRCAAEIEALVAEHPGDEPSWGFLALVHHARGDRAAAEAAARRAVALVPESPRARWVLDHPGGEVRP